VPRAVDTAMETDRPAKRTVRALWVERVATAAQEPPTDAPLYLTLPGAAGHDIQALIDADLLHQTETGALASGDVDKVVAVEFDHASIASLQTRFPGLRILEDRLENILHSTRLTVWPTGETKRFLRARVVNLDLNAGLTCEIQASQLRFPIVELVRKIAILHGEDVPLDWTLCLTLDARIHWGHEETQRIRGFLRRNFDRVPNFEDGTRFLLGTDVHGRLFGEDQVDFGALEHPVRQMILMSIVPKAIAYVVHENGWRIETIHNLTYGGEEGAAAMVTWIMSFRWDQRSSTDADIVYQESLDLIHSNCAAISANGRIAELP